MISKGLVQFNYFPAEFGMRRVASVKEFDGVSRRWVDRGVIRYRSEYADLPRICVGPQPVPSKRVPAASTSSSSTQLTAPAPVEAHSGNVVMAHEDPVVSYDIDDLHAETPVAHDAIPSPDISYSDRDIGSGIGAL